MSLAEAGYDLGFKGKRRDVARKAKRVILAKERRIRKQIMLRTGTEGNGVRYVVTRWALHKWMSEYYDRRDQVAAGIRKYTAKLENELKEQRVLIEHLGDLISDILSKLESAQPGGESARQ